MPIVLGVVALVSAMGAIVLRRRNPSRAGWLELGAAVAVLASVGAGLADFAGSREMGATVAVGPISDDVSAIDRKRQRRRYDLEAERELRRAVVAVLPGLALVVIAFGWRRRRGEEGAPRAGAAIGLAMVGTAAAAVTPWGIPPHGPPYDLEDPIWRVLEDVVWVEGGAFELGCPSLGQRPWASFERERATFARSHPGVAPVSEELRARRDAALVACIDEQLVRAARAEDSQTRRLMIESLGAEFCSWKEVDHAPRTAAVAAQPAADPADDRVRNCECWGPPRLPEAEQGGGWACFGGYRW